MLFALRDHREGRQIAIVVQQQMKFHLRRNLAQSNIVAQRSITVASKLSRGFLKRNFEHRPWQLHRTVFEQLLAKCQILVASQPETESLPRKQWSRK